MEEWWSEGHLGSTMRTSRKCGREAWDDAKVGSAEGTLEEARKERKTCPWLEGMGTWSEAWKGMGNSVQGLEGCGKPPMAVVIDHRMWIYPVMLETRGGGGFIHKLWSLLLYWLDIQFTFLIWPSACFYPV